MSSTTSIEWTSTVNADGSTSKGRTWNPVRGCSVVSPGCINCYAMKQAHRFSGEGKPFAGLTKQTKAGPQWTGKVVTVESALLEPLSWRKPQRVFVNSMSDLFHEQVPDWFISEVFATMALAPRHTFQILTKRAERMRAFFASPGRDADVAVAVFKRFSVLAEAGRESTKAVRVWPLPNVWLGVSVENQQYADERIPLLLQTPAAVRFISAEPLLGPVDLQIIEWLRSDGSDYFDALSTKRNPFDDVGLNGAALDWVICGGESGPGARPCDLSWIRGIVEQCHAAGVSCFVKQIGKRPVDGGRARTLLIDNTHGGDPRDWPTDLDVREFPEARP